MVVNGSFGGGGEWWLCFLWVFFYGFVVNDVFKYMDIRRCDLFKVWLHEFLVGLMVILERFFQRSSTRFVSAIAQAFRL